VIFLFLRNVSATIIPSLALPISIIGTFAVMALLGYTLDNLSLMALTLRWVSWWTMPSSSWRTSSATWRWTVTHGAAIEGGREIGFTILSMTLSLAAVFIPCSS